MLMVACLIVDSTRNQRNGFRSELVSKMCYVHTLDIYHNKTDHIKLICTT